MEAIDQSCIWIQVQHRDSIIAIWPQEWVHYQCLSVGLEQICGFDTALEKKLTLRNEMDVDKWEEVNVMVGWRWDEKKTEIAGSPLEVQTFYVNIAPFFSIFFWFS